LAKTKRTSASRVVVDLIEAGSKPKSARAAPLGSRSQGLEARGQEEDSFWVVRFEGSDAFLQCQKKDGLLRFATLDQSSFDESQVPPQAFEALMELGWECDESVG
jgi:hypothetical protein